MLLLGGGKVEVQFTGRRIIAICWGQLAVHSHLLAEGGMGWEKRERSLLSRKD